MRCCVPFCRSTADNAASADEVTFHSFPSDATLRMKWLRALGIHDEPLEDSAVVCSQHFVDDDFCNLRRGVRQVRSDVIPSAVKLCMICLDTERNVVALSKYKLEDSYEKLTGHSICREGYLKPTLCIECAQRLINFNKFRSKSLRARSAMMDLVKMHETITMQHITQIKNIREQLQSNIVKTLIAPDHYDLHIKNCNYDVTQTDTVPATEVIKTEETQTMLVDRNVDGSIKVKNEGLVEGGADKISEDSILIDIKIETITLECPVCYKMFSSEEAYNAHHHDEHHGKCDRDECDTQLAHRTHTALHSQHRDTNQASAGVSSANYPHKSVQVLPTETYELELQMKNTVETGEDLTINRDVKSEPKDEPSFHTDLAVETPIAGKALRKKPATESEATDNLTCQYCEYKCSSYEILVKHLENHTFDKLFSCKICDYVTKYKSSLVSHMRNHTGEKPFSCTLCEFATIYKSSLVTHMRIHTGENPFSCNLCEYACKTKSNLRSHMRTHSDEKPFTCTSCEYTCKSKGELMNHMKIHTDENLFSCKLCKYTCNERSKLVTHMTVHIDEKPLSCNSCDYTNIYRSNLVSHMRIHTSEKPFSCNLCDYACKSKTRLVNHKKIHTDVKPFACNLCEFAFRNKGNLKRHMSVHTNEKPFACNLCEYASLHKSSLVCHMRTHTGENPFSCDICEYRCKSKGNLISHMRTHSGEKPYSCNSCKYACKQKNHLIRHMKVHSDEKLSLCYACKYIFKSKSDLTNHLAICELAKK